MRVLYGVCGEGMGHAMRSAVVAEHLQSVGHDVWFVSSGSAHKYLAKRWPGKVAHAPGLRTVMAANRIQPLATLISNIAKLTIAPITNAASFTSLGVMLPGKPDVVISDFDSWSASYASVRGIPLVAVDNIHFMNRCTHPLGMIEGDRTAAAVQYLVAANAVPNARRYLVTTFAAAPVAMQATTLHHPILRRAILEARPTIGDHVNVYFNEDADHTSIAGVLQQVPETFRLYGRRVSQAERSGNVTWMPFSEDAFIRDMASSKAVIGGAGFTAMTEAIYLGKPMLAVPFGMHFEQILNSVYLERLGYGERARGFDAATLRGFLGRVDGYRSALRSFKHDGNRELLRSVEEAIR